MMTRAATRSATRTGWLKADGTSTTPWPMRIRDVCWATAVSQISGAEQWLNSSRKWCSTAQMWLKPESSAVFACSRAFQ